MLGGVKGAILFRVPIKLVFVECWEKGGTDTPSEI
jgi:hypothetical protein